MDFSSGQEEFNILDFFNIEQKEYNTVDFPMSETRERHVTHNSDRGDIQPDVCRS